MLDSGVRNVFKMSQQKEVDHSLHTVGNKAYLL